MSPIKILLPLFAMALPMLAHAETPADPSNGEIYTSEGGDVLAYSFNDFGIRRTSYCRIKTLSKG